MLQCTRIGLPALLPFLSILISCGKYEERKSETSNGLQDGHGGRGHGKDGGPRLLAGAPGCEAVVKDVYEVLLELRQRLDQEGPLACVQEGRLGEPCPRALAL